MAENCEEKWQFLVVLGSFHTHTAPLLSSKGQMELISHLRALLWLNFLTKIISVGTSVSMRNKLLHHFALRRANPHSPGFVGIFSPACVIIQSSKSLSSSKNFLLFECQFELTDTA